jgi:asparagine synthase (glutamine-hydrolysing)
VAIIGPCGIPDGELSRLAIHGVPDDVAWQWPGSYTVIEASDDRTTVWTDLGAACPLYTLAADGGVYWSSSARALAGLTGNRVDADRLAASLVAPAVSALTEGRSAFADVEPLPPGHRVSLFAAGRVDSRPVWRPQQRRGGHVERLRAELSAAVAVRVDAAAAPTVDLSGGYDSTGLALLAADRLHPLRTITGVTLHPEGVTSGGDMTYARLAGQHPGIDHRWMPLGNAHLPFGGLDRMPVTDEPAPSTLAYSALSGQLRWIQEQYGSDCHMTGDGGDTLLCTPPLFLADLVRAGRYRRAVTETVQWARMRHRSVLPLLRAAMRTARTRRATALDALARSLTEPGRPSGLNYTPHGDVAWFAGASIPPWSTPELRQRLQELASTVVDTGDPSQWPDWTSRHIAEVMATVGRTARTEAQLAESCGVPLHNPFCDSRLIDVSLSVPLDERPGPADYKPIMRDALADLFPPELSRRVTKGNMAGDYFHGLRLHLAEVEEFAHGRLAAMGLLDPARFRAMLAMAAAGLTGAYGMVEPVISAEAWLRAVDAAPAVAWKAAASVGGVA